MFGKHTCSSSISNVDVKLTLDLTDYIKTEDLTDYVKTEDLTDYVKTEDLTDYVTTEDLTDYIKTIDLTDYAKKDDETFTGTTTIDTLAISNSATTILGENNESLHFNNNNGYYAFHINNTPYFYVTSSSCYVNTTLGIDTNEKQILFYRENNFWYFHAENNGTTLQIKSGTSLTNWNHAFTFYQNGNLNIPGLCTSHGLYNTSTLHQGGEASFYSSIRTNCLENQFEIQNVNNFWYFNAPAYDFALATNKLTLWPGYSVNNFQAEPFTFYQNGDFNVPAKITCNDTLTCT